MVKTTVSDIEFVRLYIGHIVGAIHSTAAGKEVQTGLKRGRGQDVGQLQPARRVAG